MNKVGDVFNVAYGDKRYENKSRLKRIPTGTPLIAAGGRNNGIVGRYDIPATKKHIITVIRTGAGSVGKAFYHGYPCEATSDAIVLSPRSTLSPTDMLWYAAIISLSRFRFSFGRKITPGRLSLFDLPALGDVLLSGSSPDLAAVVGTLSSEMEHLALGIEQVGRTDFSVPHKVAEVFNIEYGNSYELCHLNLDATGVNFVSRTAKNNGVSARVSSTDAVPFPAGCLTVALSGTVLHTAVQLAPFYTGWHIAVLKPILEMSVEEKLFCCMAIKLHKFRYSYGRQANRTLDALTIPPMPPWFRNGQVENEKQQLAAELRNVVHPSAAIRT